VGRFGIPIALFAKLAGLKTKVHIFEPGRTAALIPFAIQVNGLDGYAELIEAVASNYVGIGALRFDPAHLVPGRAYVPGHNHITRLCRATTLDAERARLLSTAPALVKIDTEGHEVEVLGGGARS
jgi:FkbM family methyltransferase